MAVTTNQVTATGTVASGGVRLLSAHVEGGAADGTLTLRDGGAGGTVLFTLGLGANLDRDIPIKGGGLVFGTDLHATLTSVASATFVYDT